MAMTAAPTTRRGRPSAATLTVRLLAARERNDLLRLELRAAGQEMRAAGLVLEHALHNGPDDHAIQRTAASLVVRGEGYARR
jgi:hypothetical protein